MSGLGGGEARTENQSVAASQLRAGSGWHRLSHRPVLASQSQPWPARASGAGAEARPWLRSEQSQPGCFSPPPPRDQCNKLMFTPAGHRLVWPGEGGAVSGEAASCVCCNAGPEYPGYWDSLQIQAGAGMLVIQHAVQLTTQIRLFSPENRLKTILNESLYISISGPGETRDNWGGYLSRDIGDTGHREGQETGCHKGEREEEMVKTMMIIVT